MAVDYDHSLNSHSVIGPAVAFPSVLQSLTGTPRSLVDVGCGTGTWIKAAMDNGLRDVFGVDGVAVPPSQLAVPQSMVMIHNFAEPLDLRRRYDVALCLEVAEHLDAACAPVLISSLTRAADVVVFSAACPNQPGQHHVNCQWPEYWQKLFNECQYACDDAIRWRLWNVREIEPWYRQNMFIAVRSPDNAGKEPRLLPVLHPDMAVAAALGESNRKSWLTAIANGAMPVSWYFTALASAMAAKCSRFARRLSAGLTRAG
jgi:SAM-dependent methyltransferase